MDNVSTLIAKSIQTYLKIEQPVKISCSRVSEHDYNFSNYVEIINKNKLNKDSFLDSLKSFDNDMFDIKIEGKHVNIDLKDTFVFSKLQEYKNNKLVKTVEPKNIVIDYSSPNVAKDMHVGHLRSTIIGDTLARLYSKFGHNVSKINHIGDFGLPFGKIIEYIRVNRLEDRLNGDLTLQQIYVKADEQYKKDEEFAKQAHIRTVELQSNTDPQITNLWKRVCEMSKSSYDDIYTRLNVQLTEMGESFYNPYIQDLIIELKEKGLLIEKDGRMIVTTPIDGQDPPLTIVKSDGGYTYDTTDLTALKYRLMKMKADVVYYVVDSGQSKHFKQIIHVAKQVGWVNKGQQIEHINFGIVKGADGKRIRSRNGENPKLIDLLNEAVDETKNVLTNKRPDITHDQKKIDALAYGSIKYSDLATSRITDYVFSYDKMLSFTGNTLSYLMYSYIRVKHILQNVSKHTVDSSAMNNLNIHELDDKDFKLLKVAIRLPESLEMSADGKLPHLICSYLYELANTVDALYKTQRCVSTVPQLSINYTRANMFLLIFNIMAELFEILNIATVDEM